jgi:hypothetical protein
MLIFYFSSYMPNGSPGAGFIGDPVEPIVMQWFIDQVSVFLQF